MNFLWGCVCDVYVVLRCVHVCAWHMKTEVNASYSLIFELVSLIVLGTHLLG